MAEPSLATATHGRRITLRTSSSDIVWKMPLTWPPSSAMMSMQVSMGLASPRSLAMSAIRLPSYWRFFSVRARASAMPVQPPCSSAHVAKSLSALSRARAAGSFSRAANLAGPPSRIHSGKNAFQPWNIAVYGYWLAVTSSPRARAASSCAM